MEFLCLVHAVQFYVGGEDGWTLKPSENYIHRAERYRFQINDEIVFKYKKGHDSVFVVNENDYSKCNKENPIKILKDGDSKFKFEKSGPFFFISGHNQNCEKGEKFIVVVLSDRHRNTTHNAPSPRPETPLKPPSHSPSPSPSPSMNKPPTSAPITHHSPTPSPAAKSPTHVPPVKPPSHTPSPSSAAPAPITHRSPSPSPAAKSPTYHVPPVKPPSHSPSQFPAAPTPITHHSPSPSPVAKSPTHAPLVKPPSHLPSPSPAAPSPITHHSPTPSPAAKTPLHAPPTQPHSNSPVPSPAAKSTTHPQAATTPPNPPAHLTQAGCRRSPTPTAVAADFKPGAIAFYADVQLLWKTRFPRRKIQHFIAWIDIDAAANVEPTISVSEFSTILIFG
ncbi:hypothetical protein ABFS83_07G083100 [Erythranthe nasuta]